MKTQPISLLAFHNKVKELAEKAGKTVYSAQCDMCHYTRRGLVIEFKCYVEDFSFYDGSTPTEALTKLRNAMFPPKQSISDVVVVVEGGEDARN